MIDVSSGPNGTAWFATEVLIHAWALGDSLSLQCCTKLHSCIDLNVTVTQTG